MGLAASHGHQPFVEIDLDASEAQQRAFRRRPRRPPQRSPNPSQQLADTEGFRYIIVGSEIERRNLVLLLSARREDDNRHLAPCAHVTDYVESVAVGET